MNPRLLLAAILAILAGAGLLVADRGRGAEPVAPLTPPQAVVATLPERLVAGESASLGLAGLHPGEELDVLVAGTLGTRLVSVVAGPDGHARAELPGDLLVGRGAVSVHLGTRDLGSFPVAAAALDPEVRPYVGPRTIHADGADHTMVVAIPTDVHGNPAAVGTAVDLGAVRPDGRVEQWQLATDGLLAWERVGAGTLAGRTRLRVQTEDGHGPTADVVEVAGPPVEIVLSSPAGRAAADGRSSVRVSTELLVDAFGNEVADGTQAVFEVSNSTGTGIHTTAVTAGRAAVELVAPTTAGDLVVVVHVAGTVSPPLRLAFTPLVGEAPARLGRGRLVDVVEVGPVLDHHGAWVPDGTPIRATWGGLDVAGQLVDGTAVLRLEHGGSVPAGPITLAVGGTTMEITP